MPFLYEVLKETEKAIYAKIPYWEPTCNSTKKHKQKFVECWFPKFCIGDDTKLKKLVVKNLEEKRRSNGYQRVLYKTPFEKYDRLGQYAPEKTPHSKVIIDIEKCDLLRRELMAKYNVKDYDQGFFINPSDLITDEIEKTAKVLRNPSSHIENPIVLKKTIILYE